ncbi:MAG: hypothetical protein AB7P76_00490 [Candidatus Melainabacteria bacterium]
MNRALTDPDLTLIGISGKQFAGKDQLAHILLECLPGFRQLPLALAIKTAYAEREGITLEALEANKAAHRPGLIALGDWGRAQDAHYWLKKVLAAPGKKIVSDVRLQREFDGLKAAGGYLIRLEADRAVRAARGTIVSEFDTTECELDHETRWDAVLTNNGTLEELRSQVAGLL